MKVHIDAEMPLWLARIIKPLCYHFWMIPSALEDRARQLLDAEQFDMAERYIERIEKDYGNSGFITELKTMLSFLRS